MDDAALEDVTARMTNIGLSPTGKRVVVESRGEIFTIPAEKGDVRNLTNSSVSAERDPAWSPDGKFVSYFSDKSGEYQLVIESQDGLGTPRVITLDKPTHYYTASWSPDSKKLLYTDTNLNVWVMDIESGKAKIVGRDPWMVPQRTVNPTWSPDSKYVTYAAHLNSLYHAIFISNVETGEAKQVTDGLADAVWPVFDASGKYLWFFASTDFGLRSQWLDMTSYDHSENFGLYLMVLKKSEPSPLLPESDEDSGVTFAPGRGEPGAPGQGGRGGRGGGRGAAPADAAGDAAPAAETPAQPQADRAARGPANVQIDFDGLAQRILAIPGVPARGYGRLKAGVAGTVFYEQAAAGARMMRAAVRVPAARSCGRTRRECRGGRRRTAPGSRVRHRTSVRSSVLGRRRLRAAGVALPGAALARSPNLREGSRPYQDGRRAVDRAWHRQAARR